MPEVPRLNVNCPSRMLMGPVVGKEFELSIITAPTPEITVPPVQEFVELVLDKTIDPTGSKVTMDPVVDSDMSPVKVKVGGAVLEVKGPKRIEPAVDTETSPRYVS